MSRLPPELLLHIVDCLIPANPPVAFPASHAVTRTLLALCLVSKAVHSAAIRHLFAHCLYIDAPNRLKLLLANHHMKRAFGSHPAHFSQADKDCSGLNLETCQKSRPTGFIKSLFLAPLPYNALHSPEITFSILSSILDLCKKLGPHLTRLVIDIPLRSLYSIYGTNQIHPDLPAAFQELTALEEFVSTQDELFLNNRQRKWEHPEIAVWSTWPNLKRLALFNVNGSPSDFLRDIQRCRSLTHLVLTRADYLAERISPALATPPLWQSNPHLQRVLVADTVEGHGHCPAFRRRRWKDCFLGKVWNLRSSGLRHDLEVVRIDVPAIEEDAWDICQDWVREEAIQGTLWEAQGAALSVKESSEDYGDLVIRWQPSSVSGAADIPDVASDSD